MSWSSCAHCGLPVFTSSRGREDSVFCCYGCYLVSRIAGGGDQDTSHAWSLMRLGIGAFLSMDVMMISLLLYTGTVEASAEPVFRWILLGLATPAMVLLGYPFVLGAGAEIRRHRLSLNALIAVGALAAFAASAASVIGGAGHIYFDTATMLLTLVTVGRLIEATAKTRTGQLVRGLETLLPGAATRLESQGPRQVAIDAIRVGDLLQVRPGERFAADGRIEQGVTTIEQAAFTGEAGPRACGPGDAVLAGTVNGEGGVVVRAQSVGEDLLLHRIIDMVEQARRHASPSERIAERMASAFIPAVLILAGATGILWLLAGNVRQAGFSALAVLVVACPCAMGLAAPLATALAIGRAARQGVLVRGGEVLEAIGRLGTIFFDKTGTVTRSQPTLHAVELFDPALTENDLLGWLAGLEAGSEHALATAIVEQAKARGLALGSVCDLRATPGLGVRGRVTRGGIEREVLAGAETFVRPTGAQPLPAIGEAVSAICVAWEGKVRGRVLLKDALRPDAASTMAHLHLAGVTTVLLSGDRAEAARSTARLLGIQRVEAPRGPDEKIQAIRQSAQPGRAVGMVGDGINDAPALAAADVGIAVGGSTDLARQVGHVVLLSDRLAQIPWLIELSRRTRRIIVQNLLWALGYNAVALLAAALGWLHPLLAAVAMVVSSLTVLSNSLRLQNFPDKL